MARQLPLLARHLRIICLLASSSWLCLQLTTVPTMYHSNSNSMRNSNLLESKIANIWNKALRRSIKGDKDKGAQVSITPKAAVAIVPPKKVRYSPAD